ncbi:hypothetical protein JOD43_003674 [Pullulanibacillus pueri]|uniref:DUF4178 domain-containing protein n=1 Tax=Pullulanibacillus pueri TaxID=1437324 RepID=A0A8J3ENH8_9BACL|nr:DUF4178 domain-containing protein [Pullulanibacillus pueri]MBM7683494.1 hypothetical protein [Pullulanibacillus pueri]GGH86699.1 hypothetical protein GCM10007096_35010 [Pullulanibacillus pueri]
MGIFRRLKNLKSQKTGPEIEKRTLMNLRVGDMVTYELEDFEVVGKIIFNDHGFQWFEYQLENPDHTLWLSVELDDELELGVYHKVKHTFTEPIPHRIEYDGIVYTLDEKGTANVSGQGRNNNLSGQMVRYFDFCDDEEEAFLSIEIWGGEIEASQGHIAHDYDFNIIAGS